MAPSPVRCITISLFNVLFAGSTPLGSFDVLDGMRGRQAVRQALEPLSDFWPIRVDTARHMGHVPAWDTICSVRGWLEIPPWLPRSPGSATSRLRSLCTFDFCGIPRSACLSTGFWFICLGIPTGKLGMDGKNERDGQPDLGSTGTGQGHAQATPRRCFAPRRRRSAGTGPEAKLAGQTYDIGTLRWRIAANATEHT